IRFLLKDILEDEGYLVDVAEHAKEANEIRRTTDPDLVLLDIWMPDVDGVTLLKQWKSSGRDHCPVVMMSGHGTVETAVEATRYGAIDFVEKPLSMAKLISTVKTALAGSAINLRQESKRRREEPVGNSLFVQNLKQRMQDLRGTNQVVFLSGPAGSGRGIWADYLSESVGGMDIFDTSQDIRELLPLKANLYVEEITDLSLGQQAELLAAIQLTNQDSKFRFIVSSRFDYDELKKNTQVDPRLAEMWRAAIIISPLDNHVEDIPQLLEYYVNWFSDHEQLPYRHFDVAAQNLLRNHHWAGEINQLKQFVKAVLKNSDSENIELSEIEAMLRSIATNADTDMNDKMQITIDLNLDLREAREAFEREYLSRHLALSDNNVSELARRVGQERTHLYRKLKSLGLQTKKQ
ncbi:MAG: response regulator, partial [Gammaproteobacteria bacterium]|nr:response regulator [Gammaproteobacteria bacterium]